VCGYNLFEEQVARMGRDFLSPRPKIAVLSVRYERLRQRCHCSRPRRWFFWHGRGRVVVATIDHVHWRCASHCQLSLCFLLRFGGLGAVLLQWMFMANACDVVFVVVDILQIVRRWMSQVVITCRKAKTENSWIRRKTFYFTNLCRLPRFTVYLRWLPSALHAVLRNSQSHAALIT
jgi:hypothetical protein